MSPGRTPSSSESRTALVPTISITSPMETPITGSQTGRRSTSRLTTHRGLPATAEGGPWNLWDGHLAFQTVVGDRRAAQRISVERNRARERTRGPFRSGSQLWQGGLLDGQGAGVLQELGPASRRHL